MQASGRDVAKVGKSRRALLELDQPRFEVLSPRRISGKYPVFAASACASTVHMSWCGVTCCTDCAMAE